MWSITHCACKTWKVTSYICTALFVPYIEILFLSFSITMYMYEWNDSWWRKMIMMKKQMTVINIIYAIYFHKTLAHISVWCTVSKWDWSTWRQASDHMGVVLFTVGWVVSKICMLHKAVSLLIYIFTCVFIHLCIYFSFINSFLYSSICLCIHSFVYLFIGCMYLHLLISITFWEDTDTFDTECSGLCNAMCQHPFTGKVTDSNNSKCLCLWKHEHDNNNNKIIIACQRCNSRFFAISTLCREPSPTRTLWPGHNHVQITCNTLSAHHVQHVMLHAAWYEGTTQLLSLTEFKSHLFELYFIGWTINVGEQSVYLINCVCDITNCMLMLLSTSSGGTCDRNFLTPRRFWLLGAPLQFVWVLKLFDIA